ncbi:MAG: cation-translocating P-type ATPase [Gammaproteobacteria bacterium]
MNEQPGTTERPYQQPATAVLGALGSDVERGLSQTEAELRLARHGPNTLEASGRTSVAALVTRQFRDGIVVVLLVAAALAFYLDDDRGGTILVVIVLVNAAIGAWQEFKAERVLDALRRMVAASATVIRDGEAREVGQDALVPGDVVVLEEGAAVPADLRLVETTAFGTNDFILTGESLPQDKDAAIVVEDEVDYSRQDNMAFFGTTVARGNAVGVVVATGMDTAIGDIARTSASIERDASPLQQEMAALARALTRLAGVIAVGLFALNVLLRGDEFATWQALVNASLLFAIGVAAACVPQGLPAQISVALSLGVGRMAKRQAVVKRLSAVETLGATTVICSDKTGTITANEMTIVRCWLNGRELEVTGDGYDPAGEVREGDCVLDAAELEPIKEFFQDGFLAGSGRTHPPDEDHPDWYAIGDPTGAAFTPLVMKAGLDPAGLEADFPELVELPFDSERKRMSIVREHNGRTIGFMKGATEAVLAACTHIHRNGGAIPLDDADRDAVLEQVQVYSAESLRVIALAYRDFHTVPEAFDVANTERGFVFAGLVAMADLPRPGVRGAVRSVREAGMRVIMITGDDPVTAEAVARRIGMAEGRVLTGEELAALPEPQLRKLLADRSLIFSRVSPRDKHRVVMVLKRMGDVVAVTGDGVNDTLSLKQADIGVAMGGLGSDVAKEAAEIVLVDDNFSTLVAAVREGRTIFQNLRRVILSSITSNLGELSVVCLGFVGVAAGLPIPITAVQILAVDLIGEMLPLMALTFDPAEPGVMKQPPRRLGAHIVNRRSLLELVVDGTLMGAAAYFSFFMVLQTGGSLGMAQAATWASIVLVQYGNILSHRSRRSLFGAYLLANRPLWQALGVSLLLVLAIVNLPALGQWFGFEPMRAGDWLWPVLGAAAFVGWFEIKKAWLYDEPANGARGETG